VRSEDGIDQGGFSESRLAYWYRLVRFGEHLAFDHTNADHIELETSLEELLLDLLGDAVEANMASGEDRIPLRHCHRHLVSRRVQGLSE
jgi:hypothetical protein